MDINLIKLTTTYHNTWLIDLKKDTFSKKNGILFGDTLRLSISKTDSYYFSEAVGLTYEKEVLTKEQPSDSEIAFFQYMKIVKEQVYSKTLAAKYNLEHYLISIENDEL